MIRSSKICAVQQMYTTVFGGSGYQSLSFVFENDRRGRELLGARLIPTLHRQGLRIERDQRVRRFASTAGCDIERSVSAESRAGYAGDVRLPGRDLFGDEIERPHAVRRAAAVPLG